MRANRQQSGVSAWLKMVEGLLPTPDWPLDDRPIKMIQTHISVVLLGNRHVLKLKKPVNFGFLDYTTLEKRRRACEAEVSLNRRLCPDTYLGLQPIVEAEVNRHTYQILLETGRGWLNKGQGVIFDATFRHRADREMAREMAAQAGAGWRLIECRLSPQLVKSRLNKRLVLGDGKHIYGSVRILT